MERQHWYLHADLDAFFASVEQLDHPEYRGKPVIVGGLPTDLRSVVSTASYEARKFGVHSAMPTKEAFRLCPHGIYLRGNHHRYEELSWQIMQIFARYSPDIQQMSIDEAFIDLTGTERLFGPPEETAMKIKKAVKEETGLTVSIGLAQSKYFAKLSSDINKPDGFYFMKPGSETDFMLSLPIEKIWGIGKKTSARIKESGLKTTRQIYDTPLPTLTFLYGENTANFLYNILRGKCDDMFGTESKTHSLSNERTFPVDVSDPYACETALMELAHSVMFRLLRENLHSRTVVIKIRYDDFSTVSARQTYETEIITLDSFFEKVRALFTNKYDRTKGVRLLGVGFDNVHKEESIYQQELFDDGQKKKQAVEKAILNIEKKFPEIPVHKARIIKPGHKALAGFLLSSILFSFSATKLNAREKSLIDSPDYFTPPLLSESPSQLFDITKEDSRIEFFSSGFWKTEIIDSTIFSFGKDNAGFSTGIPVFKQEVDLSFLLTYNKQWFFETNFADEFRKNTITFGFKDGKTVKKALLSNRNIVYPNTYSSAVFNLNPAGGSNQSPGFSANLQGEKWKADFLIRYDMLSQKQQVFYGKNQVTDLNISPASYISGRFFQLPQGYTEKIKNIYVEDKNGNFKSPDGRKFKKLDDSKFMTSSGRNMIFLSRNAAPYTDPEKKPYILVSFLNDSVAEKLTDSLGAYNDPGTFLGDIQESFTGKKEIQLKNFYPDFITELNGEKVLILQTKRKFSPFEAAAYFSYPVSSSSDFSVISLSSGMELDNLKLSEQEDFELFSRTDFFSEKYTYLKLYKDTDSQNVNWRFPLSQTDPEIYLFDDAKTDTSILIRTYLQVQDFSIPSTASGGSVTVTINGIPDPSASFDSETGTVSISRPISQTDRIVISWNEEGSNFLSGALTGAAGFSTILNSDLSMDFDITSSLPILKASKQEELEGLSKGYVSANTGILYKKNNFSIQNNTSFSVENENMSGEKIIYTPEEQKTKTWYNSSTSGYKTQENPFPGNLEFEKAVKADPGILSGIKDNEISGYAIPMYIDFTDYPESERIYSSADIKLKNNLYGKNFSIALKTKWTKPVSEYSGYKFFLQLGTYANNEGIALNKKEIPYWEITDQLDPEKKSWQQITIPLSEKNLAFFTEYHDARIIVVKEESVSTEKIRGTLLIGPYETELQNSLSHISWNEPEDIVISDYFQKESFINFNKICFNLRINSLEVITPNQDLFTLTLSDGEQISLRLEFSDEVLSNLARKNWHKIQINKTDNTLLIDENLADSSAYSLYINNSIPSSKITLSIKGAKSGDIETGKLTFEDSDSTFKFQNYLKAQYTWKDRLNMELVSQAGTATINGDTSAVANAYGMTSYSGDFIKAKIDARISSNENILENAGHEIKTSKPLLGLLSYNDSYRFGPDSNFSSSTKNLSLDLNKIKIPVSISINDSQKIYSSIFTETSEGRIILSSKYFSSHFESDFEQKLNEENRKSLSPFTSSGYFDLYGKSFKNFFEFGNDLSKYRNLSFLTKNKLHFSENFPSPEIEFSIKGKYRNSDSTSFTDEERFSIQFPFKVKKQNFNAGWEKASQNSAETSSGGSYATDTTTLFEKQNQLQDFYKSFIFADLFSFPYENSYTGEYFLRWNRPMFNNIKDFLIPVSFSIKTGREYLVSDDGNKDSYQFKVISNSQSFNLFGDQGQRKLFNWYQTDEFTSSIEGVFKFPKSAPENLSLSVSLYGQALFFIDNESSLKTSSDFFFSSANDWETRNSVICTTTGKQSILASLTDFLIPDESEYKKKISRKETLNFDLGKNESGLFSRFELGHNCEVTFEKYYSVFTAGELSYSHFSSRNDFISLSLTLGAKITY